MDDRNVLVVAATPRELGEQKGLVCGIGPVEAAAATARALALSPPDAVLHVGLAGGRGFEPGTIVVGTEARYEDISAAIPVVSYAEPDPALVLAAQKALPEALTVPIVTRAAVATPSDTVSQGALVEAMEGFGVLRACEVAGVPGIEVRVISNEIGEEDRGRWEIERALTVLHAALPRLVAALGE